MRRSSTTGDDGRPPPPHRGAGHRRWQLLLALALVLAGAWLATADAATTIIVVRHAEKARSGSTDPPLSAAGVLRARSLAHALGDIDVLSGIDAIYASPYRRTRDTAKPLASALGLKIEKYDPLDSAAVAKRVLSRHTGQSVLIVGHSNTIGDLIAAFGGSEDVPPIADDEYDNMYILVVAPAGEMGSARRVTTLRLHYGQRSAGSNTPS
jgi:broad specificity phosphatase PhoE